jgi:hypothetical protein
MPVGMLLRNISSSEITEWIALFQIENEERKQAELDAKVEQQSVKFKHRRR